jgi:tetratricopeptide (TPR) repeat protein
MPSTMLATLQSALDSEGVPAAVRVCEQRLREAPDDSDTLRHLSQLHARQGARVSAFAAARRTCELAPNDPRSWSDLGRVHVMFDEYEDAAVHFARSVRLDPAYADGWHNLGTALKRLGKHERAFHALKSALQLDPSRAGTYLNLGNLLIEAGQFDDAVECFERAARHDPKMAAARSRLAEQVAQRGKVRQAESLFRQALGLDPDHVHGWFGLGRTLEDLGDAENALACYRQVLARRPNHAQALGQYLSLLRDDAPTEFLNSATAALNDDAVPDEARALIGYGLAKHHDRRREFDRAAAAGLAANAARRRSAGPADREGLRSRVDGLIATYDSRFFFDRRHFGVGTDQPVFIVGLPRSGTTLCEQILASHPQLHGAGELPDLANLAAGSLDSAEAAPWQAASRLTVMQSREIAVSYSRALRSGAPKGCIRISDKSPLNFFHLAFAAVLFPNARVIHCKRDARDNALSIWMENFNPDQRYATDFHDLAFFRAQYERIMAHWQETLPLRIHQVQYEDTVKDVETQARKLMKFLDVPWDARCLEFHRNERAVQTPSRWQVRQPIYSKSVKRAESYAALLPELVAAFPRHTENQS